MLFFLSLISTALAVAGTATMGPINLEYDTNVGAGTTTIKMSAAIGNNQHMLIATQTHGGHNWGCYFNGNGQAQLINSNIQGAQPFNANNINGGSLQLQNGAIANGLATCTLTRTLAGAGGEVALANQPTSFSVSTGPMNNANVQKHNTVGGGTVNFLQAPPPPPADYTGTLNYGQLSIKYETYVNDKVRFTLNSKTTGYVSFCWGESTHDCNLFVGWVANGAGVVRQATLTAYNAPTLGAGAGPWTLVEASEANGGTTMIVERPLDGAEPVVNAPVKVQWSIGANNQDGPNVPIHGAGNYKHEQTPVNFLAQAGPGGPGGPGGPVGQGAVEDNGAGFQLTTPVLFGIAAAGAFVLFAILVAYLFMKKGNPQHV